VEAEASIRRLLADYCHTYDEGDTQAFGDLFAVDATYHAAGQVFTGRQEIVEKMGPRRAGVGQHATHNSVIEVDPLGVTAHARSDFFYLAKAEEGFSILAAGQYFDHMARETDRWRFSSRTVVMMGDARPATP
jgi:uncharacterized protein (TIGR02246 family)